MADIAFMPERHIFQGRHGITAHQACEAGQVFTQHRVALMRHGGRPLLPGMEKLLCFPHFAALQMAHLGREPFNPAGNHGERREESRVTVTRDYLCGNRFHRQTQLARDKGLHTRINAGKGANRAGNGTGGHFGTRRHQPGAVAGEFRVMPGQFQAEGGGLGMDAMAAADGGGEFMFHRAGLQRRQQRIQIRDQQIGGLRHLHGKAGIQHIG